MRTHVRFFLVLSLLGSSCDQPDPEQRNSLVGTYLTPTSERLRQETVQIDLSQYHDDTGIDENLLVELRPDNTVLVSRARRYPIREQRKVETQALRKFRLTNATAADVRSKLARLRPQHLTADMAGSLPTGCQYICDGAAEFTIAYWDKEQRFGVFELQHGCTSANVPVVRKLVKNVLSQMNIAPAEFGFSIKG
ncbi:hypothetical protein LZ518_05925 [Sphingomonas sp. RB56-2]|uniref:Uncharacterized protein n=1 Tax=Sphingomonas brevis TaxID=2908206 RepID=A0ABT0S948_9SPHN|nr:hypothetical protein [Sphingomonas brevis]MCL6740669.1 hypothetical protein [Sphingomonas brevis]